MKGTWEIKQFQNKVLGGFKSIWECNERLKAIAVSNEPGRYCKIIKLRGNAGKTPIHWSNNKSAQILASIKKIGIYH